MGRTRKLPRGVAIVGAGMTKFGLFKDRNCADLFAEAFKEMCDSVDKGLDPRDIEAIYVGNYSNDFFVKQAH
jgi:acetyl-CoA acetyltransferase